MYLASQAARLAVPGAIGAATAMAAPKAIDMMQQAAPTIAKGAGVAVSAATKDWQPKPRNLLAEWDEKEAPAKEAETVLPATMPAPSSDAMMASPVMAGVRHMQQSPMSIENFQRTLFGPRQAPAEPRMGPRTDMQGSAQSAPLVRAPDMPYRARPDAAAPMDSDAARFQVMPQQAQAPRAPLPPIQGNWEDWRYFKGLLDRLMGQ